MTMETTQITRIDNQMTPGMQRVAEGNGEAAREMDELVKCNSYHLDLLPMIFAVAARTAAELKEKICHERNENKKRELESARSATHKLAVTAACKMTILKPEYIEYAHKAFLNCFSNPGQKGVTPAVLRDLLLAEMVFLGSRIIRNERRYEIADAIADGLERTDDTEKKEVFHTAIEVINERISSSDHRLVYQIVFDLAERRDYCAKHAYNRILMRHLDKELNNTNPNQKVISRIIKTLEKAGVSLVKKEEAPLMESPPLPTSHITTKALESQAGKILPNVQPSRIRPAYSTSALRC